MFFAAVLSLGLAQPAVSAVVEVPVIQTGIGGASGVSGAALGSGGGGSGTVSNSLSAPTLTGSRLPAAINPSPSVNAAVPQKLPAVGGTVLPVSGNGVAPLTPVEAPNLGSKATQKELKAVGGQTREIQGIVSPDNKSGKGGERAAAIGSSLFDGGSSRRGVNGAVSVADFPIESASRQGHERRRNWFLNGRPAEYLDGGGSKDVLIHPQSDDYLITLFNQRASDDAFDSRSERQYEMRSRRKMEQLGFSPKVVSVGALNETKDSGTRIIHYFVQERVKGRKVSEVSAMDLHHVRTLFDQLIVHRIKILDDANLLSNIMIGETVSSPKTRAFVVDNGGTEYQKPRGFLEKWFGGEDALAAYYEMLFRKIRTGALASSVGKR